MLLSVLFLYLSNLYVYITMFSRRKKLYKKDEIKIFTYHNGTEYVAADPIDIQIKMEGHEFGENIQELFDAMQQGDVKALKDVVDIGRVMFNIEKAKVDPETGELCSGLTSHGVMKVMSEFIVYMEELKKNIDDMQIGVPATESPETLDTSASLECGSTSTEK